MRTSMRNEYDFDTAEVFHYLDSINLHGKVEALKRQAAKTNKESDNIECSNAMADEDFCRSIKGKSIKYGSILTPGQVWRSLKILKKFATKEQLIEWGLYEDPPPQLSSHDVAERTKSIRAQISEIDAKSKECIDALDSTENTDDFIEINRRLDSYREKIKALKREIGSANRANDSIAKEAIELINPFFTRDSEELDQLIAGGKRFYGNRYQTAAFPDWARPIALSFLSDYREQLPIEIADKLMPFLPSTAERDTFFIKYTPEYIKFMLNAIIYGVSMSLISLDANMELFVKTYGKGDGYKGKAYRNREAIVKWKETVEKIQKKLTKAKLDNFADYLSSPLAFENAIKDQSIDDLSKELSQEIKYTEEQKAVALEMMEYLASVCNYAITEDTMGFNKSDAVAGHRMAAQGYLSDEDMPRAVYYCRKYKRQLPQSSLEVLGLVKGGKKRQQPICNNLSRYLAACVNF